MTDQDYRDGWNDGKADRAPAFDRLALGANGLNDYERGYIDSGRADDQKTGPRAKQTRKAAS